MEEAIQHPGNPISAASTTPSRLRILRVTAGYVIPIGSLLLHFAVMLCFINQWDRAAAVTVFPIWCWAVGGILIAFVGWLVFRTRLAIVAIGIWIVTTIFAADETGGMLRVMQKRLTEDHPGDFYGKTVYRVVTLNCSKRNADAAAEVARFNPDIVLLQEVPSRSEVHSLAHEMFGDEAAMAANWHCAILTRGKLQRKGGSVKPPFESAVISFPDGAAFDVFSIHLEHAVTRWDLWDPDCWRSHAQNRRERRRQLQAVLERYAKIGGGTRPCLIGGDFNAPPSDSIFGLMRGRFGDGFKTAGRGWGNTFFNRFPALRIDQIWSTSALIPINARAVKTQHSDHRMLVVDYILNK